MLHLEISKSIGRASNACAWERALSFIVSVSEFLSNVLLDVEMLSQRMENDAKHRTKAAGAMDR